MSQLTSVGRILVQHYNTAYRGSAGVTPFELVYGRKPPTLICCLPGETLVEAVANDLMDRDEILNQLTYHLQQVQNRMSHSSNKHRRDVSFNVGDWVYPKLCHARVSN